LLCITRLALGGVLGGKSITKKTRRSPRIVRASSTFAQSQPTERSSRRSNSRIPNNIVSQVYFYLRRQFDMAGGSRHSRAYKEGEEKPRVYLCLPMRETTPITPKAKRLLRTDERRMKKQALEEKESSRLQVDQEFGRACSSRTVEV